MIVFVTGASGFIGNHVVKSLLSKGIHVVASSRNQENAKKMSWFKDLEYIQQTIGADLSNKFKEKIKNIDVCMHLAWDGLPVFKPEYRLNFTWNLKHEIHDQLSYCKEWGAFIPNTQIS